MFILGCTALMEASFGGHLDLVKCLLGHKANIEATDDGGVFLNFATTILSNLCVLMRMIFCVRWLGVFQDANM